MPGQQRAASSAMLLGVIIPSISMLRRGQAVIRVEALASPHQRWNRALPSFYNANAHPASGTLSMWRLAALARLRGIFESRGSEPATPVRKTE
jgi:hypothetical protein